MPPGRAAMCTTVFIRASLSNSVCFQRTPPILAVDATAGTVGMIIPFNIASGTYTLKLFNEHINGDFKTDYASAFADVTLPANSAIGKNGEDGVTPYVGENGN